jgi:hypothetical protein
MRNRGSLPGKEGASQEHTFLLSSIKFILGYYHLSYFISKYTLAYTNREGGNNGEFEPKLQKEGEGILSKEIGGMRRRRESR